MNKQVVVIFKTGSSFTFDQVEDVIYDDEEGRVVITRSSPHGTATLNQMDYMLILEGPQVIEYLKDSGNIEEESNV